MMEIIGIKSDIRVFLANILVSLFVIAGPGVIGCSSGGSGGGGSDGDTTDEITIDDDDDDNNDDTTTDDDDDIDCTDNDGDGYGDGVDCLGVDCDDDADTGDSCHSGCTTFYADDDGDLHGDIDLTAIACTAPVGFVADNTDCDPDSDASWSDCGTCVDVDGDTFGAGCDTGPDCDDDLVTGNSCHTGCTTYYDDTDNDGYGNPAMSTVGCVQPTGYVANSSDCDPTSAAHYNDCATCVDADSDDYGTGCDAGADCDDSTETGASCHTGCTTYFDDTDDDGYGDASDSLTACTAPDGYVTTGNDCDATNDAHWSDCDSCVDDDSDGYGADCDLGTDCNDSDDSIWTGCPVCTDGDGDSHDGYDAVYCATGDDNCDDDGDNWTTTGCASCTDADGDGYGVDCDRGTDCDDNAATGSSCHTGCSTYYQDLDGDNHGTSAATIDACSRPANYASTSDDNCDDSADADEFNWTSTGCASCVDADGDGYGVDCDLGTDCDDDASTGPSCHTGCSDFYIDNDGDGHGDSTVSLTGICSPPSGYAASSDDNCDDTTDADEFNWSPTGCTACVDADGDGYGADCDYGDDCYDSDNSIWVDCPGCVDNDGDGHDLIDALWCPIGDDNCDDDLYSWSSTSCTSCVDNDGDGYGVDCDYGSDCVDNNDTIPDPNACPAPDGMVTIAAACYNMGDTFAEEDPDELPVHNVCLSAYYMDVFEVTNAKYEACVDAGGCTAPMSPGYHYGDAGGENYPVGWVSWTQAYTYCDWAGKRLPTEAEWEYAARGGTTGLRFPWGDTVSCAETNYYYDDSYAYDIEPATGTGACTSEPLEVGSYAANGFSLYDMIGNMAEMTNDWYDSNYYSTSPVNDPPGAASGTYRVVRGGSYISSASMLRLASRHVTTMGSAGSDYNGFRCAQTVP